MIAHYISETKVLNKSLRVKWRERSQRIPYGLGISHPASFRCDLTAQSLPMFIGIGELGLGFEMTFGLLCANI